MTSDSSSRNPVEKLAEEFIDRRRRGELATIDEYVQRFPQWSEQIRDLFPTLMAMERLGLETLEEAPDDQSHQAPKLERIGDYRILREVGRGGMGVVYEAEQESLRRRVALKVMLPSALVDSRQLARFEREARAAARLHHTNIVPVFGVGRQDALHYFVMQLIDGQGLDRVLSELRRLRGHSGSNGDKSLALSSLLTGRHAAGRSNGDHATPTNMGTDAAQPEEHPHNPISSASDSNSEYYRTVARLTVQAAAALDYANAQGVLHRDVKPANLLLDSNGTLWVTDFGLAKATDSDDLTHTGDVVGTLRYMAPERFDNEFTVQSDIYGLGLTLYELVTLRPAYDEADRARLIGRILNDDPPAPRKTAADMPRDLETILLKAISRQPSGRYASAGEFAEDLQRFLDDRPIQARRIGALERSWRWCRRNPALASLVAVVILSLAAVSGAYVNTLAALADAEQARGAEAAAKEEATRRANEAVAANALALENLDQAKGSVDDYLIRVSESELLNVAGMQPLRRELLELALAYYEGFIRKNRGDPTLKADLAAAHQRVAQVNTELGSAAKAMAEYELAAALFEEAAKEHPGRPEYRNQQSLSLNYIGLLHTHLGSPKKTEATFDRAIEVQERIVDARPDALAFRLTLVRLLLNRSNLHSQQSPKAAQADSDRALDVLQSGEAVDTESADYLQMLANTYRAQARNQRIERKYDLAAESYIAARLVMSDLVAREPTTDNRFELSRVHFALSVAFHRLKRTSESMESISAAIEIQEDLVQKNPSVTKYRNRLAGSHRNLAAYHDSVGDGSAALAALGRAVEIRRRLADEHAEVVSYQASFASSARMQANLQENQNLLSDERRSREVVVQAQTAVVQRSAQADAAKRILISDYQKLGIACEGQADDAAALVAYEAAHSHARELVERLNELLDRVWLARLARRCALIENKLEHFEAAREFYEHAVHVQEFVVAESNVPVTAKLAQQRLLFDDIHKLASLLQHRKSWDAARIQRERGIELARGLRDASQGQYQVSDHLLFADANFNLANLNRATDQNADALAFYAQAIEAYQAVLALDGENGAARRTLASSYRARASILTELKR